MTFKAGTPVDANVAESMESPPFGIQVKAFSSAIVRFNGGFIAGDYR